MTDTPIQILLVDDHALFREGLARLLNSEAGMAVVGTCASVDHALTVLASTHVDVVLLDYDLGDELATAFLESVAVLKERPKILIVTAGMTEKATWETFSAGAVGVVLKHSGPLHLLDAIHRVMNGDMHLDDDATQRMLVATIQKQEIAALGDRPLTRRQSSALRGILDGLSNKEIAESMKISESSVKAILQELFHKAGVRTRSQLVRVAIEKHSSDWIAKAQA